MGADDRYKRSDLFLLRIRAKDVPNGSGKVEWRGKVQRVVDGESHQFSSLQGLVDLLLAMLLNNERR